MIYTIDICKFLMFLEVFQVKNVKIEKAFSIYLTLRITIIFKISVFTYLLLNVQKNKQNLLSKHNRYGEAKPLDGYKVSLAIHVR